MMTILSITLFTTVGDNNSTDNHIMLTMRMIKDRQSSLQIILSLDNWILSKQEL